MNKCIPFKVGVLSWSIPTPDRPNGHIYTAQSLTIILRFGTNKPPAHAENGVELFPETLENYILTRLSARENFIEIYSLYSCNTEFNNIVYKVMNCSNQFIESQREGRISQ